ncbi:uncharacterized protein BCR38DRAFT_443533 [Pseudomassariella vexata]|uniref:Uncharacterized protein n=1 Tax=Pseudomassariella vexata TaxID=1141098 RepID=A0A1Y2DL32_9PEZI|nr:uncharacterized protein BCR38DRAFT_443533 [Pseudomassariella vexata]ORY59990.1 hypothetical protein BCR38DRAFT_443533 [Pseudomassariella vexata]
MNSIDEMDAPIDVVVNWTAPAFTNLNFTHCNTSAKFYAGYISAFSDGNITDDLSNTQDLPAFADVLRFLRHVVPEDWMDPPPDWNQLAAWYFGVWDNSSYINNTEWNQVWYDLHIFVLDTCRDDFCDNLDVKGDADVTGTGMMGSYYTLAILSTIYFTVITMNQFGFVYWLPGRTIAAFTGSVETFLDSALVFAVSMAASTIFRYAALDHVANEDDLSSYRLIGSIFMCLFAVFPCLALQTVAEGLRDRTLRHALWFTLVALNITAGIKYQNKYKIEFFKKIDTLSESSNSMQTPGILREFVWLAACDDRHQLAQIRQSITASHVVLGMHLGWLLYYFMDSPKRIRNYLKSRLETFQIFNLRGPQMKYHWKAGMPILGLVDGTVCCIMMWYMIVIFTVYRQYVRNRAHSSNEDGNWTFGQTLSLVTWVPVLLEWLDIIIRDPKDCGEAVPIKDVRAEGVIYEAPRSYQHGMELDDMTEETSHYEYGKQFTGYQSPLLQTQALFDDTHESRRGGCG